MLLGKRPEIERFLAKPDPAVRAVVIHGRDRSAVAERAEQVARKSTADLDDPFTVARLNDGEVEGGRLLDELAALSMLSGRRLVRVRLTGDRAAADKALAEALEAHLDGRLNPEALLLVEAGALGRDSLLRKKAEAGKAAVVMPVYDDEPGDLARLARESLAGEGIRLAPPVLDAFIARLPKDRGVARQEIERLALFAGAGGAVSEAELEDFLGVEADASLSDAAEAAFGARWGDAHGQLRRAAAEGEDGVAAVRALSARAALLGKVLAAHANGMELAAAAKSARVFWKAEREFLRQARSWTPAALGEAHRAALQADRAAKQGGGVPPWLIAEQLALTIARQAKRLGL